MRVIDVATPHSDGSWISARISRIVEAIRDYSHELDVQWIPPQDRLPGEAAFRIIHSPVGKPAYVAFTVQDESQFDERVLQKLYANDQANRGVNPTIADLDAYDMAQREMQRREFEDRMAEANDIAYHVLKSNKNTYRVNKNLVIKEHGPQVI